MTALLSDLDRATRGATVRRYGIAASLLAAAGAVVPVPFLWGAPRADHTHLPAAVAITIPTNEAAATVAPSNVTPAADPAPSVPASARAAENGAPSRPVRARANTPPSASLRAAPASAAPAPQPTEDAAQVVEGRNGAPIMR